MKIAACLGFLALLFVHLYRLTLIPGLHFDEAWAANFSVKILSEPGFWPIEAMSPYTSAWSHYVAALFFKFFGINLEVYRLSQLCLSGAGLLFLFLALRRRYGLEASYFFPIAILVLPGIYLNHRFGIELNSMHVFVFGWLLHALTSGRRAQAALAVIIGVTSHLLFFAVVIACLAFIIIRNIKLTNRDRAWIVATALLLAPFFFQILQKIPEVKKALLLLVCNFAIVVGFTTPLYAWLQKRIDAIPQPQNWFYWILSFLFLPLLLPLFLFSEGHWTVFLYKGAWNSWPIFGVGLLALIPALVFGSRELKKRGDHIFFILVLVFVAAMVPKATPRYFELPMLCLAICVAIGFAHCSLVALRRVTLMVAVLSSLLLFTHQLLPGDTVENKIQFLFLKDESADFLSKQHVAAELGLRGCGISDIRIADFRGGEGLRFLRFGDWPVAKKACEWPQAIWRRASQPVHAPERLLELSGTILER